MSLKKSSKKLDKKEQQLLCFLKMRPYIGLTNTLQSLEQGII